MSTTTTTAIMCHRYSAITLWFTMVRSGCRRQRCNQRVTAGAAASSSPDWVAANASNAIVGGELLCTVWPGTPSMLTGYGPSHTRAASVAAAPADKRGLVHG